MNGKPKILVVDDNAGNKLLLQYSLDGFYDVEFASNGLSALNKFKQNKYDLILMDVYMPELDGIETTKRMRQMENGSHTPIIALTAFTHRDQKIKCMEAGMDDFLIKPIHAQALIEHLNNYIKTSMSS